MKAMRDWDHNGKIDLNDMFIQDEILGNTGDESDCSRSGGGSDYSRSGSRSGGGSDYSRSGSRSGGGNNRSSPGGSRSGGSTGSSSNVGSCILILSIPFIFVLLFFVGTNAAGFVYPILFFLFAAVVFLILR